MEIERLQKVLQELELASTEIANSNLQENTKLVLSELIRKENFEIMKRINEIKRLAEEHEAYMETHRGTKR